MSRRRAAVVPFALVRAMLLAAAAERSAATKGAACSCYSCGQVQEPRNAELTHNSALSQTYRACEARGACAAHSPSKPRADDPDVCETDVAKGICDCHRRNLLPTLKCGGPYGACSGRAAVCLNSPLAPICNNEADEREARRVGYRFYTFSPMQDHHVSYWLHRTGGFYDFQQHWILDHALRGIGYDLGAAATAALAHPRQQPATNAPLVLDVGSNLGTLTLYAAWTRCCRVHAFELQREVANVLRRSIVANGFASHVTLHHNAVSDVSGLNVSYDAQPSNPGGVGLRPLRQNEESGGASGDVASAGATIVRTVSLDELFFPRGKTYTLRAAAMPTILMMKVDAEGHEMPILRSAERLLRAHAISHIMVELRREQAVEFTSFMYGPAIGYECRWRPSGPMQHKARSAASRKSFASAIAALPAGGFRDAHCTPQKKRS